VPPLRERREDIPVLLDLFLRQLSESHHVAMPRMDEEAAAQLTAADWPGNVRQLRNVAERLVVSRRADHRRPTSPSLWQARDRRPDCNQPARRRESAVDLPRGLPRGN
jgi:DNA-binding NtrC family response regulator